MKTTHLLHREGLCGKRRSWTRALIHDELGKEWIYYRLVDNKFYPQQAACFCRFELDVDRLVIARCLSGIREDIRRLIAEGPPPEQEYESDEDE